MTLSTALSLPAVLAAEPLPWLYALAPLGAIIAVVLAYRLSRSVLARSEGEPDMVRIAAAVRQGARAYLFSQYRLVLMVFVALVVFLVVMYRFNLQDFWTPIGVLVAGLLSGLCGWFGMKMATSASARTASAAKASLHEGLTVAFRSGAVIGFVVVGFALLDASLWFAVFHLTGIAGDIQAFTTIMLTFGMGASTQALFARVGGGIYTKAADVGADLVGKVEAGIAEDDPRNPATIADNVGDNVGDVAGMGADLYESYYGSLLATMALGAAAAFSIGMIDEGRIHLALKLAATPLALAGVGVLASLVGVLAVKAREGASFAKLLAGLHKGVYVASGIIAIASSGLLYIMIGTDQDATALLTDVGTGWWRLWLAILAGLVAGNVIAFATDYYTSYEHTPTRRIAQHAGTGPAMAIIAGIAEGMKSTWASLATIVVAILTAFVLAGGNESFLMGLYGVGIAAVGMLSTLGITLATDAYGPIADNAGGIAEMTHQPPVVRERTDMLDSLGNTTAATGKGFAIGSAALTALALFAAFIQVVQTQITHQAESWVADIVENGNAQTLADHINADAFAVYEGYGKFAVVFPGEDETIVDGGMVTITAEDRWEELEPVTDVRLALTEDAAFGDRTYTTQTGIPIASARNARIRDVLAFYDITLTNPRVLSGIFIGVLLVFLFCALTMNAVGRAAYSMMNECRRQFAAIRESLRRTGMSEHDLSNPDHWPAEGVEHEGRHYPDYATCVSISTAGAQRAMVAPSLIAILIPIAVGLTLSVPGVMGMLAGGLTSGFAVAIFMANAGGAWDNAKKLIESCGVVTAHDMLHNPEVEEHVPPVLRDIVRARASEAVQAGRAHDVVYGKGSDDHKAAVIGDTVGDPFKDTAGPSLNILIKLISIVSVVFAGLTVAFGPVISDLIGLD